METTATPVEEVDKNNRLPATHLPFLDGLRALLAVFVVVHHAYLTVWSEYRSPLKFAGIPRSPFLYGHWAVTVFIVISGFCLMLPVVRNGLTLKGGALVFLQRRAHRILPTYYAALILSTLLCFTLIRQKTGTHWDVSIPVTIRGLLVHLVLLHNLTKDVSQINHAFWSIAVECQIYLLFPLFVLLWRRVGARTTLFTTALISAALALSTNGLFLHGMVFQYWAQFAFGALAAYIVYGNSRWQKVITHPVWQIGPIVLVLCLYLFVNRRSSLPPDWTDWVIGSSSAALIASMAASPRSLLTRIASLPPLVWIGTFSYSIYLIHAPLLQVVWQYLLRPLRQSDTTTFILLAIPGTLVILALSYLFYLPFERPFVKRKPDQSKP